MIIYILKFNKIYEHKPIKFILVNTFSILISFITTDKYAALLSILYNEVSMGASKN